MIEVKLINSPKRTGQSLAQHAARACYEGKLPGPGVKKRPDVKRQLLETGHHTTLEHGNYTFSVEGVSVGDVTFGFHYTTPYYNTDQRSGRYTADMFNSAGTSRIEALLDEVYPNLSNMDRNLAMAFVGRGIQLFHENLSAATEVAARWIREDRPRYPEKNIPGAAKKFAQEQLRAAIPVIFPTAFYYTVDLITLISQYRAAWKPGMRLALRKMVELVTADDPGIAYMFADVGTVFGDVAVDRVPFIQGDTCYPIYEPVSTLIDADEYYGDPPPREDIHPFDFLPVKPEYMTLRTLNLRTKETMSLTTMGQDQRHRSVRRSAANFTGQIYVPPLAREVGMDKSMALHQQEWLELRHFLDPALHVNLAPYGAVVSYVKSSDFASAIHDLVKRSCWQAQEEHYNKDIQVAPQIEARYPGHMLPKAMTAPCHRCKICGEGTRFCGRDMSTQDRGENYYPVRRV